MDVFTCLPCFATSCFPSVPGSTSPALFASFRPPLGAAPAASLRSPVPAHLDAVQVQLHLFHSPTLQSRRHAAEKFRNRRFSNHWRSLWQQTYSVLCPHFEYCQRIHRLMGGQEFLIERLNLFSP